MTDAVATADTNVLFRLFAQSERRHEQHGAALKRIGHLVIARRPLIDGRQAAGGKS